MATNEDLEGKIKILEMQLKQNEEATVHLLRAVLELSHNARDSNMASSIARGSLAFESVKKAFAAITYDQDKSGESDAEQES